MTFDLNFEEREMALSFGGGADASRFDADGDGVVDFENALKVSNWNKHGGTKNYFGLSFDQEYMSINKCSHCIALRY